MRMKEVGWAGRSTLRVRNPRAGVFDGGAVSIAGLCQTVTAVTSNHTLEEARSSAGKASFDCEGSVRQ